jgi:hypothetical protein
VGFFKSKTQKCGFEFSPFSTTYVLENGRPSLTCAGTLNFSRCP